MPSRRLIAMVALVGGSFAAAALLLPHLPGELRELVPSAGACPRR